MRVIAGTLGGRVFQAPQGRRTHPMSDKMRGALFNMLGDMEDQTILDAFSGSGALSFEAVSRGAQSVLAIEQDRSAQRCIADNIAALNISSVKLIKAAAGAWLRTAEGSYDVVLLDPPYDNLQLSTLHLLAERTTVGGQIVLSWPGKQEPPVFKDFTLRTSKSYGDGSLHVYERA